MPEITDIVLRTISVFVAVLLAALLTTHSRHRQRAVPGALFVLAVAAFWITSAPGAVSTLGVWGWPLIGLCVTKTVFFWLLSRSLFNEKASLNPNLAGVLITIAMIGIWQQTVFIQEYRAGTASTLETLMGFGFDLVLAGFVLMGLYVAWRDLAVDLVERRRHLRIVFMLATGVYLVFAIVVQFWNLASGTETSQVVSWVNMSVTSLVFLGAGWLLLQFRNESWLAPLRTASTSQLSRVESAVLSQLERLLKDDRVYLQEGLTIAKLAGQLGTGEHVLRKVINQGMGHRNFNDFLHSWRISEACEELARPEQAREPVLSIAMKVGYGSIGAFNRAFKAKVGMTPTAFRRSRLGGMLQAR
ncbi:MAG TPA: AraC family transcriptional regulator [Xanthomonadales bacterium]|nr:AraC family transcriptional regulator [Xanthomonadales bacterium]